MSSLKAQRLAIAASSCAAVVTQLGEVFGSSSEVYKRALDLRIEIEDGYFGEVDKTEVRHEED